MDKKKWQVNNHLPFFMMDDVSRIAENRIVAGHLSRLHLFYFAARLVLLESGLVLAMPG
jgi:hypothetical protein